MKINKINGKRRRKIKYGKYGRDETAAAGRKINEFEPIGEREVITK